MKKLVSTDFSAENWLILGKKWSMMIATADKYGCRTLPMRNWHNLPPVTWATNKTSSDITYEELTLTRIITVYLNIFQLQKKVGHYLWGIDTRYINIYLSIIVH